MTNPTHLRIGNLFNEKYTGQIIKVLKLEENITVFDFETEEKWQAEPIILDWEALVNLGFKHFTSNSRHFWHFEGFTVEAVYSNNNRPFDYIEFVFQSFDHEKHILNQKRLYHVHELQNLFLALKEFDLVLQNTSNESV
jgi:hypothetical protein